MKSQAKQRGVDLLVVDSGDLHDGNGLSDGFPKGGIDGHATNHIMTEVPYDVLSIGNHEMYKYPVAHDVYKNFAPKWKGGFLTSNVNITVVGSDGSLTSVPIGERYSKFTTTQGRKVLALGVLLDFINNAANTTTQTTKELVAERWFQEVIREEVDFFLLVGHMAVSDPNWRLLYDAIRVIHPATPVFIFGGHYHIRDCAMFDDRTIAMASGRYMETVGWMSATWPSKDEDNMKFTRRYLDANRVTYQYHTETTPETFDTPKGLSITRDLLALAEKFNLNAVFGIVPDDYYLDRLPWPSENSVVSLFINKALPAILPPSYPDRAFIPSIIIVQSGGQRFDMFKGPFTRNDQFIVSPFTDNFVYLSVPYGIGNQMLTELSKRGAGTSSHTEDADVKAAREEAESGSGEIEKIWRSWRKTQWQQGQGQMSEASWPTWPPWKQPTLGWVTTDSCPGGPGDDTIHRPIPFYKQPDYVSHSNVPNDTHNTTLHDLIFLPFFSKDVIEVVNELRAQSMSQGLGFDVPQMRNVTVKDMQPYGGVKTDEVFGIYARAMWSDQPA
ncbi:hypothetical protein FRB97_003826 [Tulasnella sp. 331]|nr:hypothetical protein FRB97_003826 [Tulasnella sp. 331]